ncbi:MAG: bifunctional adenosylcobinamide kinase/adenosylcobinamide-phosphate guanylyltransferase [Chloroflexota bacterium]|nr:bifunctional adenosylcobinamide kinase/adenosylcobinamide-phosphate guanylyltransferase [Chloroflexota bacterium]
MGRLILVLGGARSGKSGFAQRLAQELGGDRVVFVATAEARDEEMRRRIEVHRRTRPPGWKTAEAPRQVGEAARASGAGARVVLVDCLTLLASNTILALGEAPEAVAAEAAVMDEVRTLLDACRESTATFIVVSNEVGLGLVPDNPLGRLYRDLLGQANQVLAARASAVYLLVAGLPLEIKSMTSGGQPAR